jgi:hypothetical protein
VVINDLDVGSVTILPGETDPPLVIDSNTVLAASPPFELFQAVTRWHTQVFEGFRRIQNNQLSQHDMEQVGWKPPHCLAVKQTLGVAVSEAFDHLQT